MTTDLVPIQRILVSVTDKSGLTPFLTAMRQVNPQLEIIASGSTGKALEEAGISYIPIETYTGFPECFGGRVKTLHPKIAGGILFRRGEHDSEAEQLNIPPLDMVICNLYDFATACSRFASGTAQLMEHMDIGGSTLIRAASKNFQWVTVVCQPTDYPAIEQEVQAQKGKLSLTTRASLASKAMNLSADYEALIAQELDKRILSQQSIRPKFTKGQSLRYGENPDQAAWVYQDEHHLGITQAEQLAGKPLSYNNYEDATIAYQAVLELRRWQNHASCSVVKHGGLCGYAAAPQLLKAFRQAWEGDSKSAFGSVIGFSHPIPTELIQELEGKFVEVLIAPDFHPDFISWAKEKRPNLRLLKPPFSKEQAYQMKKISGGLLVQAEKSSKTPEEVLSLLQPASKETASPIGVVTQALPDSTMAPLLAFSLTALRFVKSNAVLLTHSPEPDHFQLVGVGGGQPNRVDSLQRLALPKARETLGSQGQISSCLLASDGFFPFQDSVEFAAEAGIRYIAQPGGSVRDSEVIDAADRLGITMIFTGERYFTH